MQYLIVETFTQGPGPVYARFRERGRLAPDGLDYLGSVVTIDGARCYQLMACDDPALLEAWMAAWRDLVAFEVIPVIGSAEAAARFGPTASGETGATPPSLGLESGTVRVVPHDPVWPSLFVAEAARLGRELDARGLALRLEHVGSTSVPGLAAKPVLDILAGRRRGEAPAPYIAALVAAGYEHRGEQGIPGRDFFRRGAPRAYHVHLVEIGSRQWRVQLAFRDYLRAHADAAAEYGALKSALAERFPRDREAYMSANSPFIARVLERAPDADDS